jgi:molybdenum cofactor cytidylyltransferase
VSADAQTDRRGVRVAGIVLAAGRATRMGGSKVVRPVGDRAMVARVVDAALASQLVDTIVVVGNEADQVRDVLRGRSVHVVHNADFAQGQSTSLKAGLRAVEEQCDGALFLLADQPFVTSALIDSLIGAFARSKTAIVRPEVAGRPSNPVLMPARLFPELFEETGDRGGRRVIERHAGDVCLLSVPDRLLCIDVDSPEDYERVRYE